MGANIRETLIGFGKKKQTDIATAAIVGDVWRLGKLNAALADVKLNTEDDAEELGKGHEFGTQTFQTSWDITGSIEKYLSAEIGAWAFAFCLGKVVKAGVGPYVYTITPLSLPTDGNEPPYFSFIEQIRPGGSDIVDRMAVGCVVESVTVTVGSGPGRANSKIMVEFIGSGKLTEPSAITLPAATAEKLLPSASLACTINGVDYVTNKNIVSLEYGWKNNIRTDEGFYPGSGFQTPGDATTGAIRGRLEVGDRECFLRFVARFKDGSTELTKLKAQTVGTAVIALTYDADNKLTATFQRVTFKTAVIGENNGIVTVQVDVLPQYHAANGVLTVEAKSAIDGICQAPA